MLKNLNDRGARVCACHRLKGTKAQAKKRRAGYLLGATLVPLILLHNPVWAQDATVDLNDEELFQLEELTVTGQKLNRDVQKTIDSVDIITGQKIQEEASSDDLFDILNKSANIGAQDDGSFSIRGISDSGATGSSTAGSTIGVYLDGAQLTDRGIRADTLSTWDIGQVEVLRGAQSTTSGRNSLAGAVILRTNDPVFDEEGAAKFGIASDGGFEFGLMQNTVLNDNVATRVSFETTGTDGYVDSPALSDDAYNKRKNFVGRGKVLYSGDDGNEWLVTGSYSRLREHGDDLVEDRSDDRHSPNNYQGVVVTDVLTVSSAYNMIINDAWTLDIITAGSSTKFDRDADTDQGDGIGVNHQLIDEYQISQEFRLNFESQNLQSTFGAYLAVGERDEQSDIVNNGFTVPGLGTVLLDTNQEIEEKFKNYALYYNADYSVTDDLVFISGLRFDYEDRDNSNKTQINRSGTTGSPAIDAAVDGLIATTIGQGQSNGSTDSYNLLPKIGLSYQWNENVNTGALYQIGYRPGGVSANILRGTVSSFDEEFTQNYELSLKTNWLNNRLTANANVFYTDWTDQQVRVEGAGGIYDVSIVNAGESHLYGAELQAAYKFSDQLKVDGYVGYLQTEFDEFSNNGNDFAGNEFAYARDVTAGVGVKYRPWENYFVNTNVNYTSDAAANVSNSISVGSYTLVDLKAGYEDDDWALNFYVNNLFDRTYVTSVSTVSGVRLGDPRVVGFNVTMNW